jgi:hypothetical protein
MQDLVGVEFSVVWLSVDRKVPGVCLQIWGPRDFLH